MIWVNQRTLEAIHTVWENVRPTTYILFTFLVIKQEGWEYANWNSKIIIIF